MQADMTHREHDHEDDCTKDMKNNVLYRKLIRLTGGYLILKWRRRLPAKGRLEKITGEAWTE